MTLHQTQESFRRANKYIFMFWQVHGKQGKFQGVLLLWVGFWSLERGDGNLGDPPDPVCSTGGCPRPHAERRGLRVLGWLEEVTERNARDWGKTRKGRGL